MAFTARFSDVLAAAQHGSEWAWGEILAELGPPVQAYARSQGADDAEDLLAQVLEGMVRGIARFRGEESDFRSWVFTIAHSRIIDGRRRTRRRPRIAQDVVPEPLEPSGDAYDASAALSHAGALAILDALPAKQRDVVALRVIAGLSVDETARVLRTRSGTVRVTMHRAMKALQGEISEEM